MEEYAKLEFIDEPFFTKLRIGTDCSGIEAPIQALRQLGIPFTHIFSSDIDKYCIQSIKANYDPEIIFGDKDGPFPDGDITKRNIEDVPDIDLYVCGFPCQPFSTAGGRKGFEHKSGNVFWSCLEVIEKKQPKYFILENVRGLLWHNRKKKALRGSTGDTWNIIWKALESLEDYSVCWKVLNTKDYGIPQHRERIFIIGIKGNKKFSWPRPIKLQKLDKFVDYSDIRDIKYPAYSKGLFDRLPPNSKFLSLGFPNNSQIQTDTISPCLMSSGKLWCVPCSRYATINEFLALQGFPLNFSQVVSKTQLRKQLGNSMSTNVLFHLIKQFI